MRRMCFGIALATAAAPAAALANDPPNEPLRASLEVDADAVEDAEGLEERVDTALGARLRRAEVLPRKTLQDGLIHVELEPLPGGGFHYDVYAEQNDRRLEETVTRADCAECDEEALLEAVGKAVDDCLGPLAATQVESADPPAPAADTGEAPQEVAVGTDHRGVGPMGKAGVGLMVAGAATAIVGVIFAVQGRSFDTRPGALEQEGVDFRPPGYGLIGVGAASLVTGGILFGVDRKRRASAQLSLGPSGGVVSVGGRF